MLKSYVGVQEPQQRLVRTGGDSRLVLVEVYLWPPSNRARPSPESKACQGDVPDAGRQ